MFDFLRNLTKSAEEKRREQLSAYLDGELSAPEREQFEQELAQDAALRAELETLRQIQLSVQQLPRVRAPRNYTLDPAVYGRPVSEQSWQLYPMLRVATALTAFFFVLALALDLLTPAGALNQPVAGVMSPEVALVEEMAQEAEPMATPQDGDRALATEAMEAEVEEEAAEELSVPEEAADAEPADEAETMGEDATEVTAEEQAPAPAADAAAASETMAAAAEATVTGDVAALVPPQEATAEGQLESYALPTPAPEDQLPPADDAVRETVEEPRPVAWLLVAEIILGIGLLGLLAITLIARRGSR